MTTDANNSQETAELAQEAAPETEAVEREQADGSEQSEPDLDTDGVDPEFEEVDIDGEKVALPKTAAEKARAALLRQADYTRKTQELAELRKQSEASFAQEKARIEAEKASIQSVARVMAIDEQLQRFANADWQQLSQSDPVQAQQAFFQYQQLKDARQAAVAQIQQHESQRALQEREANARELQQASEVLAREIKGWSPEVAQSLRSVAKELGAKDADLDGIKAPWIVRALHSHKQLMEMQSKASKPPAATPATPVKTVTGMAAKAAPNPDKMSIDEWMAWRNKQAARR